MEIYLDNSATTKLNKDVLKAMMPYLDGSFANPSSIYTIARKSKEAIEASRDSIAKILGAKAKEIYFTSGGSESDNWAIKGILDFTEKKHIITSPIEHHAVLKTFEYLKERGYRVSYLKVDKEGFVDIDYLKEIIDQDTALVSLIYANNEIGTIEPIEEVGEILKEKNIPFHVDGVQALASLDFNLGKLPVDLMSFSAHKIQGPKGIGVLYIRDGIKIGSLIHGGNQERKKRAGTENVAAIVGFARALEISRQNLDKNIKYVKELRDGLLNKLLSIDGVYLNGSLEKRLVGNINISIDGIDIQMLLMMLDMKGIYASSGSACNSGSTSPSHVLKAIGRNDDLAKNCLRISLSNENNLDQMGRAYDIIKEAIENSRR